MNITQLEKEIIKAIDIEISNSYEINFDGMDCYNATKELQDLKKFIKKCFKEHNNES